MRKLGCGRRRLVAKDMMNKWNMLPVLIGTLNQFIWPNFSSVEHMEDRAEEVRAEAEERARSFNDIADETID